MTTYNEDQNSSLLHQAAILLQLGDTATAQEALAKYKAKTESESSPKEGEQGKQATQ